MAEAGEAMAEAGEAMAEAGEAMAEAGEAIAEAGEAIAEAGEAIAEAGEAIAEDAILKRSSIVLVHAWYKSEALSYSFPTLHNNKGKSNVKQID
jgi:cellobiose-specific phosphotransferase system component IIA